MSPNFMDFVNFQGKPIVININHVVAIRPGPRDDWTNLEVVAGVSYTVLGRYKTVKSYIFTGVDTEYRNEIQGLLVG